MLTTAWIATRQHTLDAVVRETAGLEEKIATELARRPQPTPATAPSASTATGPIDWRSMTKLLARLEKGISPAELLKFEHFQKQLADITDSGLIAAFDEIRSLQLDPGETALLEEAIIEPLIEKNPKLALETFADRTLSEPDGVGWFMSIALGEWAKSDTAAASAWLDARIAEGMFDSKTLDGGSEARLEFESALAETLLASDPQSLTRRIAALPADQRFAVLEQLSFTDFGEAAQQNYLDLIRGQIPPDEQAAALAGLAGELAVAEDYAAVDRLLDQANASPTEREVATSIAATSSIAEIADERTLTLTDLDPMRAWLTGHAPESVERLTGQAVANATQNGSRFGFSEAETIIRECHQRSGNDQLIEGFLESFSLGDGLEQALPLAALIKDDSRREELIAKLRTRSDP